VVLPKKRSRMLIQYARIIIVLMDTVLVSFTIEKAILWRVRTIMYWTYVPIVWPSSEELGGSGPMSDISS
jgi:hypothetical protein